MGHDCYCLVCQTEVTPGTGPDEPCPRCNAPTRMHGRWRVQGPLARGGSARVFRGHDTETGRDVALKILDLRDVEDWKQVELFERQLPLLRRLRHPGIPEVHDAFEHASGSGMLLVLAQTLHRGPNLRDALAGGLRFDEASARAFLDRMLDILEYLHGFSPPILHRDIKPANILLEPPEDGDLSRAQPILIDFDTARGVAIDTAAADGTMVGSAGYVPIEQLAGRPVPASDLYALGVTLIAALSQRDVLEIPVVRSRLEFRRFVNVSRELADVLAKMIEPVVEDRFADVAAVRHALARAKPPTSKPPTSKPPTSKPPKSKPPMSKPSSVPAQARGRRRTTVMLVIAAFVLVPVFLGIRARIRNPHDGTIARVLVEEIGDERLITVIFTRHVKGNRITTTRIFSDSAAVLGSVSGPHDIIDTIGGARLLRRGDALTLNDRRTGRELADVQRALDDAYGKGAYRFLGARSPNVEVELVDGSTTQLDLRSLLPEPVRDAPAATRRVWLHRPELCATDALTYRDGHKSRLVSLKGQMTLLRPKIVNTPHTSSDAEACTFELAASRAFLALHRSTAFGEEGAFLLSALPFDHPDKPLWTADLTPATGSDQLRDLELLDVRLVDEAVCFWLVRDKRSLSEVCVHANTGGLLAMKVIF